MQKSTLQAFEAKYIIKNNVIPMYILYVEKTVRCKIKLQKVVNTLDM